MNIIFCAFKQFAYIYVSLHVFLSTLLERALKNTMSFHKYHAKNSFPKAHSTITFKGRQSSYLGVWHSLPLGRQIFHIENPSFNFHMGDKDSIIKIQHLITTWESRIPYWGSKDLITTWMVRIPYWGSNIYIDTWVTRIPYWGSKVHISIWTTRI